MKRHDSERDHKQLESNGKHKDITGLSIRYDWFHQITGSVNKTNSRAGLQCNSKKAAFFKDKTSFNFYYATTYVTARYNIAEKIQQKYYTIHSLLCEIL